METGALEAAEKWTEESQSVSLPRLMCLQVPLKTDEASEMEKRRKKALILKKKEPFKIERHCWKMWRDGCMCIHSQHAYRWVPPLNALYSDFWDVCLSDKVYFLCEGGCGTVVDFTVWHWVRNYWVGKVNFFAKNENSHIYKSCLEQSSRPLSGPDF